MAQEIQQIGGTGGLIERPAGRASSRQWSEPKSSGQTNETFGLVDLANAFLNALGDDSSRRMLSSAIMSGKTVEEMSAEQGLPLSTCYRKVRHLLDDGLMLLERMVVTHSGKRYAVYRASISEAKITFSNGEVDIKVTPNPEVLDKLRRRWLSAVYPTQNQDDRQSIHPGACSGFSPQSGIPYE